MKSDNSGRMMISSGTIIAGGMQQKIRFLPLDWQLA